MKIPILNILVYNIYNLVLILDLTKLQIFWDVGSMNARFSWDVCVKMFHLEALIYFK